LPPNLPALSVLDIEGNRFTRFNVSSNLTGLTFLNFRANQLTSFTFPAGLTNLNALILAENLLTGLVLPAGLTKLTTLDLTGNQFTSITLPPDMQQLAGFFVTENPLATLVLSEQLAATKLAGEVAVLRNQAVSVFTYPLAVHLVQPRPLAGAFQFGITGPPGVYTVFGSTDLAAWSAVGITTNKLGAINFTDATSHFSPQKFYRAVLVADPQ